MSKASRKHHVAILVAACFAFAFGLLLCFITPAHADEPNMDEVNAQAVETLAIKGYKVTDVALGYSHSAAITSDGKLWSWGYDRYGQLGNPTLSDTHSPYQVSGISHVIAVSLGGNSSAAITSDGSLWTWGSNRYGQLGNEDYSLQVLMDEPRRVPSLSHVIHVALGENDSAAITENGNLWTWGYNYYGQLGNGSYGSNAIEMSPQRVPGLSNVVSVALGRDHSAAITEDGSLWMWGNNSHGQLGDGSTADKHTPQRVPGLSNVVSVALGLNHSAAITEDGSLWMWGDNRYGQLGNGGYGLNAIEMSPQRVPGLSNVVSVALGRDHSAAITGDGSLWMWGDNSFGALGDGTTSNRHSPQRNVNLHDVVAVAFGSYHGAAITSNGSLWTWGENGSGQLGDGTTKTCFTPIQIFDGSGTMTPAKSSLSLNRSSLNFTWNEAEQAYEPSSATVTLNYGNCIPEPVGSDQIKVELDNDASSNGKNVYRITPSGRLTAPKSISVTFRAKSTVDGVADPQPVTLSIALKMADSVVYVDNRTIPIKEPLEDIVGETGSSTYNPELAYTLGLFARNAYEQGNTNKSMLGLGYAIAAQDYIDDDTPAYTIGLKEISDGSRLALITIQGSKGWSWRNDFNLGYPGTTLLQGKHAGFQTAAVQIRNRLRSVLGGLPTSNIRYVITGHSQGAAVGNLLAIELSDAGVPKDIVYDYNFACPDVAKKSAVDWNPYGSHDNIFNIGNGEFDPVTFVPGIAGDAIGFLNAWAQWGKFGQSLWFKPLTSSAVGHDMKYYEEWLAQRNPRSSLMTIAQLNLDKALTPLHMIGCLCPVDIYVYGEDGNIVASVVDDKVVYAPDAPDEILVLADGDRKYAILPDDGNYRIGIEATEDGEMTYQVADFNPTSSSSVDEKSFDSIELTKGKTLESEIGQSLNASDVKLYVTEALSGNRVSEVLKDGSEVPVQDQPSAGASDIYRLYNPATGEHLYTVDAGERNALSAGAWDYEGISWYAPSSSASPVWRLYNAAIDDHLYTSDANEVRVLTAGRGWVSDNGGRPLFYSGGDVELYRLYNPASKRHLITRDLNEYRTLPGSGWEQEGVKLHAAA